MSSDFMKQEKKNEIGLIDFALGQIMSPYHKVTKFF